MTDQKAIELRERRRQELGETSFTTGAQGGALMQPENGKQLMDMANMMAASQHMVRDFYRDNPGDCAALIMICQPYGFNPFMVSWKTYKASKGQDAPIAFEGQLVNAMVNMSAPVRGRLRYEYQGEAKDGSLTCTVTGVDRETGDHIVYTSPPLKDIPIKNSPLWKGDPQQQIGYYSARAWARRHFPELLLGVYSKDEIDEAPMRDVTPREDATGFGQLAKRARSAPEEPQDDRSAEGDVLTGEVQDDTSDFTPDPESEAYKLGVDAATEGFVTRDQSPVAEYPDQHQQWLAGFDSVGDE